MLKNLTLSIGASRLTGDLCTVRGSAGLVVFVHGSGSDRHSRRNLRLAETLQRQPLDTLLFDLLTADEQKELAGAPDLEAQSRRVLEALDALPPELASRPIGLFGADTGAAVALRVAVQRRDRIRAVVCRGARFDAAGDWLQEVRVPTLLIVGAADVSVLQANRRALALLGGMRRIELVPRATHLFKEAGAIETVALLASDWFAEHLRGPANGG